MYLLLCPLYLYFLSDSASRHEAEQLDIASTSMEVNSENDAEITRTFTKKHSCVLEHVQNLKRFKSGKREIMLIMK